jgi:hypothetical protein
MPTAAAVITPKVAQPRYLSSREFTRVPITLRLLVNRTTSRISGGVSNTLITADQNSIFTAFNRAKFSARPGPGPWQPPLLHKICARSLACRPSTHATQPLPPPHTRTTPPIPALLLSPSRSIPM